MIGRVILVHRITAHLVKLKFSFQVLAHSDSMTALLESIDPFWVGILKRLPIILALCQHNTLAHYAFYYTGIFDAGLLNSLQLIKLSLPTVHAYTYINTHTHACTNSLFSGSSEWARYHFFKYITKSIGINSREHYQ